MYVMVNKKNINIELLRFMAIFSVIVIHMAMFHFNDVALMKENRQAWLINQLYYGFSRFCVPIFFIISAYMAFNKETSSSFAKKIVKIGTPFIFWSAIYFLWQGGGDLLEFTKKIFTSNTMFHLWFVPSFLGYIVLLPTIKFLFSGEGKEKFKGVFIAIFIFTILIPSISNVLKLFPGDYQFISGFRQFNLNIPPLLVYGIAFPYFYKKTNIRSGIPIYTAIVLLNVLLTTLISHMHGVPDETFYGYTTLLVFISSYVLFNVVMHCDFSFTPNILSKLIYNAGDCSYGIYLSHMLIYVAIDKLGFISHQRAIIDPITNAIMVFCTTFFFVYSARKFKAARYFV